jgi:hypothetical protein
VVEEVHPVRGCVGPAAAAILMRVESNVAFCRHRRSGGRAMSAAFQGVINIDI